MTDIAELTGAPKGRRYPAGAEPVEGGYSFRVWAPERRSVEVVFTDGRTVALEKGADGYFEAIAPATAGDRYQLRLDGGDQLFADLASRFQPEGLNGPSELIDPNTFRWNDADWKGLGAAGQVISETHIGAFTPDGDWGSAIEKLPLLKEVGITTVELLPVAQWDGTFGWGYDGVLQYAPTNLYGRPDDFRAFVDAAHRLGLAVILDVVYNHFGTGDHFAEFSPLYFSDEAPNEWGKSLNFDLKKAKGSRDYFVNNAVYWIDEFHIDGLRIDAAHALHDYDSQEHVIAEIARKTRAAAGQRTVYLAAENEQQDAKLARPPAEAGYGLDAIWNEDFHHSAVVAATARQEAYMHDHWGTAQELLATAKYGTIYQGQRYDWQDKPRGTYARDRRPPNFINYLQNHDQIANTGTGERFWQRTTPAKARAITALFLLVPQTPLLFMGQEFASGSTFHYFLGLGGEVGDAVEKGRKDFLKQFQSVRDPKMMDTIVRPSDPETFMRSKVRWEDRERNDKILALHRDLLTLRRTDKAISQQPSPQDGTLDGNVLNDGALFLRFFADDSKDDRLLFVNLGKDLPIRSIPDPLVAPPSGMEWVLDWSSEDPAYGGEGRRDMDLAERFTLTGECAVLFRLQQARPAKAWDEEALKQYQYSLF